MTLVDALPKIGIALAVLLSLSALLIVVHNYYGGDKREANDDRLVERQMKALDVLATWTEWMISLYASLLGLIFINVSFGSSAALDPERFVFWMTVVSLFVSVTAATLLFGAIPDAMRKCPILRPSGRFRNEKEEVLEGSLPTYDNTTVLGDPALLYGDIYHHPTSVPWISLRSMASIQHLSFIIGVASLILTFGTSAPEKASAETSDTQQVTLICSSPAGEALSAADSASAVRCFVEAEK